MSATTTPATTPGTLLVANRGEIACRVIRAAKAAGWRTVAVFSEADRGAAHVHLADEAVLLGPTPPSQSYLDVDAVLAAAKATGATAVHPGYGFLSEDAGFAERLESEGLTFVGPTPDVLRTFGAKHTAREAATAAGVPVFAGTGILADADEAVAEVEAVGYPVMLKATGGGGGIGMTVCRTPEELRAGFASVTRMARASFGSAGVFAERYVERARHVEVQVFGDGTGRVLTLGDRDCSLQRRHQKVLEEAPAPDLPDDVRETLRTAARDLAASVAYRSAGTVEFVYDAERGEASFLEVNARLQVEHPVTEQVTGVDLVGWMLRLAAGDTAFVDEALAAHPDGAVPVVGHAVEARVYAEDPAADFRPSAGLLTGVTHPAASADVRVDGWVETGTEVSTAYDPLLAKVIATAGDRPAAWARLRDALEETRVDGIEVNLGLLRAVCDLDAVADVRHTTHTLDGFGDPEPRITVERPGLMTTVQDAEGRRGLWQVGVPPSGAMDARSLRLGNLALGNDEDAAGLECTATGPALRFTHDTLVCVTGAPAPVRVDGVEAPMWEPVLVPAGGLLDVGDAGAGLRTYVALAGGLDVPEYLGSRATFTLGGFGGHGGRALRPGDVLRTAATEREPAGPVDPALRPTFGTHWDLTVTEGPHGAPEFFTRADMETLFATRYGVHFNSARTGVRLVGPKPQWARQDGGEAGLHPSNIHDNAYSVGALDFTGDTPILLGPDGPSLGGFVCPVTVVSADRWKLGQLRPGDTVSFVPVRLEAAPSPRSLVLPSPTRPRTGGDGDDGVLLRRHARGPGAPDVVYRRSGDDNVLVEYGDLVLDLGLRARVHALHTALAEQRVAGVLDLTPGIRSLQVHVDPDVLPVPRLLGLLTELEDGLPAVSELVVPSRQVRLPLSWDDPATREAIARYMAGVRDDAPWCPWNIEFIRRVNGLESVADVYDTVFAADYLVLGLGDVYLGAPVATPLDPRHRLVTTKYNPARTWTAENSVGIGGAYLCIYGMEGPGGYQFVGRTTQVWSSHRTNALFEPGSPWLLRFFDRISWYPVEPEELMDLRADMAAGRGSLDVTDGEFSLAEHERFLADNAASIQEFRERQATAFGAERSAWEAAGEFDRAEAAAEAAVPEPVDVEVPEGGARVDAPFVANVWKVDVAEGDVVEEGAVLVRLEAMKMESHVTAPAAGRVVAVTATPGTQVAPGDALVVLAALDSAEVSA
ncbi:urea carboxylase [Nocardioides bruguierae]|uniref:urea carboxylase n=1 Tax=Nocardioides bruguierae TaxID=2945102 RepID=UPI00202066B0|nr:urea carboxylase [Nocardioides bruguierae]MCL8025278.1 urea carboxylase [Nocardioides bruguierae]